MAQHAGGMQRGLPRPEYRYRQARAQGIESGITDGIDAHGVETFLLGLEAGLEHAHIHQHGVVVTVPQGGAPADGDEFHCVAIADHFSR
jgi:hypothetical protein